MSFKNLKVPVVIVIITLLAQFIGPFRFDIGIGRIELLPLIYVCIICIFLGPKFLRIVTDEEITWANSKILVSLVFLAAYQGTNVGPKIPLLIKTGPALILQEFGNLGTILLALPIAILLGLGKQSIGACFSKARESDLAAVIQYHGADSEEGRGLIGMFIVMNILGIVFFSIMVSIATLLPFHPYALAMATGIGSTSSMTVGVAALASIYPALEEQIVALGTSSNLLSTATGIYMDLFLALPLANYLYKRLAPILDPKKSRKKGNGERGDNR